MAVRSVRARILFAVLSLAMASASAGACASFDDADDATPSGDASGDDDAADAGAAGEGSAGDAPSSDAVVDAGCSNAFDFVERFGPAPLDPGWTPATQNGDVAPSGDLPDAAVPPSPPSALLATITLPDSGSSSGIAFLRRSLPFVPSTFSLRYAFRVPLATRFTQVGCLVLAYAGEELGLIDLFRSDAAFVARRRAPDGGVDDVRLDADPTADWLRVELAAAITPNGGGGHRIASHLVVRSSMNTPVDEYTFAPMDLPTAITEVRFECGIPYADFGAAPATGRNRAEVMVDDVEVHACK